MKEKVFNARISTYVYTYWKQHWCRLFYQIWIFYSTLIGVSKVSVNTFFFFTIHTLYTDCVCIALYKRFFFLFIYFFKLKNICIILWSPKGVVWLPINWQEGSDYMRRVKKILFACLLHQLLVLFYHLVERFMIEWLYTPVPIPWLQVLSRLRSHLQE